MPRYAELPGLAWFRTCRGGPAWLDSLDLVVADCARRWSLTLGDPFEDSHVSLALAVTTAEGGQAVLKIDFPGDETQWAGEALRTWDGHGAVQLLAEHRGHSALLMERCIPGTPLSHADPDEAIDVMVDLLPQLWRSAGPPFRTLTDECARWASSLTERWRLGGAPFPRNVLDLGLELLGELPSTQGEQVLVHQDLHGGNVLRAQRHPWLAIDPKPLVGEREFALAPVIRSPELGAGREHLVRRLDHLTGALGLDRHRAACWTFAHTVAWNADGGGMPEHLAALEWLRELL
jgi:streptomycin 6-kinase